MSNATQSHTARSFVVQELQLSESDPEVSKVVHLFATHFHPDEETAEYEDLSHRPLTRQERGELSVFLAGYRAAVQA